jgi:NAD(P)-dependent dehydrogenase (short-subunit alcohol dehydrogenase family)
LSANEVFEMTHGVRDFVGKVAFITGGSSGIGFGLAQALLLRGAKVAIIGTDHDRMATAVAALDAGDNICGIILDVTDRDRWDTALDEAEAQLGPIDIVCLNAGAQGARRNIEDIPQQEWDWVWNVNVRGVFNGLSTALPRMRRRNRAGHILVTTSIASVIPRAQVSAYGASKAAALALAQSVRLELADSPIRISVLAPGLVRTAIAETMRRHAPQSDETTFDYMRKAPGVPRDPLEIANIALDGMAQGRFHIFTHPEHAQAARTTLHELDAALDGA